MFQGNSPLRFSFFVFIAVLGSFLFGYQTGIISGALVFLTGEFNLSHWQEGLLVSITLAGACIGGLISSWMSDACGRKRSLIFTSFLFVIGTLLSALASSLTWLFVGRALVGVAVGFASALVPLYLGEIAPPQLRGRVVSIHQVSIATGMLCSYLIAFLFGEPGGWRWMFGLGLIPALLQLAGMPFLPESLTSVHASKKSNLKTNGVKIILIGCALSIFQQITGCNTVFYYAPKIFLLTGFQSEAGSLLATVGIGSVALLATLFSIWLIDRVGRKPLLLLGLGGMVLSLAALSLAFFFKFIAIDCIAILSLMAYVAFFGIGIGPITWVVLSEIFPLEIRGKAMGLAVCANWLFNYLVSWTFPDLVHRLEVGGAFSLYALIGVAAIVFVVRYLPETKGTKL